MMEVHCDDCGGFISDPRLVAYRLPGERQRTAAPRTGPCACGSPTVYGPPPGRSSSEMPGAGYTTT